MDATLFTTGWLDESPAVLAARGRAQEVGLVPLSAILGSLLSTITSLIAAKTVVEIGTGTGVGTLCLLRGMRGEGVVTSIDSEPEHQRLARAALAEEGVSPSRARLIVGASLEVLPRLSDHAYDLVFLNAAPQEAMQLFAQAQRLLRSGGAIVVAGVLKAGRAPDVNARDADSVALLEFFGHIAQTGLPVTLLPIGDGLLLATYSE